MAEEGERRVLETIDAAAVRRWAGAGVQALEQARDEIDGLNVYPVADGDTGTNLLLTVQSATEGLCGLPADADLPTTTQALATGALLGARGSSGIILSQFFRGLATSFRDCTDGRAADGSRYAAALRRSADLAYAAVAHPVEGTMLTVARAAAEAAEAAGPGLPAVARAACDGARAALGRTPGQLEVLRQAGVVDAGGSGLCVLLDALLAVVEGMPVTGEAVTPGAGAAGSDVAAPLPVRRRPDPVATLVAYEVMYLLDADDESVRALTARLDALGDALAVVGGDGIWNVHVHVADAGAAVEAGVAAGRLHHLRITALPPQEDQARLAGRAVVAVAAGDGLAELLVEAGATVVRGGPGGRASAADLLDGIRRAGRREVVLVPNDPASLAVADAAAASARSTGHRVAVVPSRATVQALAAVAVHDPDRDFHDDLVAMSAAAASTRHGAVTVAARDAMTTGGPCRAGDVLGVSAGDFVLVGDDLADVAVEVIGRTLQGGGELVTLVRGTESDASLADAVAGRVCRAHPGVEVVVHDGGQPRYPLLFGVE